MYFHRIVIKHLGLDNQPADIFIITMPNTTGIDLREAAELSSTNTFGTKYLQALQPFEVIRFASWSIGREYDYNPLGLDATDTNWTTRWFYLIIKH